MIERRCDVSDPVATVWIQLALMGSLPVAVHLILNGGRLTLRSLQLGFGIGDTADIRHGKKLFTSSYIPTLICLRDVYLTHCFSILYVQRYLSISRRLARPFFPLATNSHAQSISPASCRSKRVYDHSRFYANFRDFRGARVSTLTPHVLKPNADPVVLR